MKINFEIVALFSTGYLVGLSTASAFIAASVKKYCLNEKSSYRSLIWTFFVCLNIFLGAINPVILIAIFVVGDNPHRQDFWLRISIFLSGIILGAFLVLFSMAAIGKNKGK